MARKTLSSVDTAWLRMEDPTNMMMITGVMVFGAPMDYERLMATIEHGLLRFDRFRQRVVRPAWSALYWAEDPDFDLRYHLQRATLPPPGDQAALQELASVLASRQLDLTKPLWQFHLVEEYGEGCALICRLHHCIGDGLALVHVLLSLTTSEPDETWPSVEPTPGPRRRKNLMRKMLRPAKSALRTTVKVTDVFLHQCQAMRADRSHAANLARTGARGTTALARLLLLWPDPKTIFKGPLGVPKRVAWSSSIPLEDVKTVGQELGGTVNDVLLTAMSGSLRRYLQGRGEEADGLNFRAIVPVNLRLPGTEEELGNKFGLVFLSLPVGIADPGERLEEVRRRMDALKDSLEAPVAFGILNAIGTAPETIQDIVVTFFGMKGTAVITNVMGPKKPIYLACAPLDSLMFWVPQSGRLGLGVSILSYAGRVWLGVMTDRGLVPDPETIVDRFHAEFDELLEMARAAGEAQEYTEALTPVPERCQALTQTGRRCKNRPLPGSDYCQVHQD
jgi:diacylglycerol O-acyltransferase